MIKVESVTSFATSYVSMGVGNVVSLPNDQAEKLIDKGFVREVEKPAEPPKSPSKKKGVKADEDQ